MPPPISPAARRYAMVVLAVVYMFNFVDRQILSILLPAIRDEFWTNVRIPGSVNGLNVELEKAGRVADFIEFAEVFCHDALNREESCGGHFRSEHQFTEADPEVQDGTTQTGEAKRHDDQSIHVPRWEHKGVGAEPTLQKESLE